MSLIDFHIHTNNSDGDYSVDTLLDHFDSSSVKFISFTDHDCLTSCNIENRNFTVIPGIEFYADYLGNEVHILGYGMKDNQPIIDYLELNKRKKRNHYFKILYNLSRKKIRILPTYFADKKADIDALLNFLVENSYAVNKREAYEKYLVDDLKVYPLRIKDDYKYIIDLIRISSGKAILAHPLNNISINNLFSCISDMQKNGLSGIECSTDITCAINDFQRIMAEKGLCITYGSDFHGSRKNQLLEDLRGIEVEECYIDGFLSHLS